MASLKASMLAPVRESIDLSRLGLSGVVWVRSLDAGARTAYIDSLFDKDGKYDGKGAKERLLALTVEEETATGVFALLFSEDEAKALRPDVAEVLSDVAQRLSLIREEDRLALKKAYSATPSGATPMGSPNGSGTPQ